MVTAATETTNADLEKKILAQVEYYFSKVNLRRDKFMRNTMSENDGWMPLESLLTFNRLKQLTTDKDLVWKIAKTSEILKTEDENNKIRPLEDVAEPTEEEKKDFAQRTVHLKGFEKDAKREDLQEFCEKFGKVEHLDMRMKFKTREFKGCVHVTYVNKDDADKVLADDELKVGDKLLLKENMEQYAARKQKYHEEKAAKREAKKAAGDNGEKQSKEFVKTPGVLLKLTGLEPRAQFSDIKAQLGKNRKVAFVGNINESGESIVRFADENGAVQTLEELKGSDGEEASFQLGDKKISVLAVTEEEEDSFWNDFQNRQTSNKNKHFGGKRKGHFGRGRGGYKKQRN